MPPTASPVPLSDDCVELLDGSTPGYESNGIKGVAERAENTPSVGHRRRLDFGVLHGSRGEQGETMAVRMVCNSLFVCVHQLKCHADGVPSALVLKAANNCVQDRRMAQLKDTIQVLDSVTTRVRFSRNCCLHKL